MNKVNKSSHSGREVLALLECINSKSDKFYEIEFVAINSHWPTLAFGAIFGKRGSIKPRRIQKGSFADEQEFNLALERLVISKLKRGYQLKQIRDVQLGLFSHQDFDFNF